MEARECVRTRVYCQLSHGVYGRYGEPTVSEYKWCQLATDSQVSQETIIDKLALITSSYYEIMLRFDSDALCSEFRVVVA